MEPTDRVVLIVLDGVGVGATPDAVDYGDEGSNTLGSLAEAVDAEGNTLASVLLDGGDPYEFTARILAWAATTALAHGVSGTGALGPVDAFGLDALVQGCAEAGLVVRDPV